MTKFSPRGLALVLILYLILTISYSIIVPIGRGADEWAHYWYAQFIAEHGRLPLTAAEREVAGYKSDWPPLYHLCAAAVTAWIETDGPPTIKYRADHVRRQLIPATGSEAILHTEDELFPWRQEILVWHIGRFLSITFSFLTLIVTYLMAREVFAHLSPSDLGGDFSSLSPWERAGVRGFHRSQNLATITTACLAFNPRFLFTGMLFNYDSLTLLLSSLFFLQIIRVATGRNQLTWLTGFLAGLALMTKYLTALLPLELIIMAWLTRPNRRQILQLIIAFMLTITPWFAYLVITFNEIATYGPVLGTLAPLIRGDGSDRTIDELFAMLSGGESPPPAHIEKKSYTFSEIATEFPLTFWTIPTTRPYPLTWFVIVMSLLTLLAVMGLIQQAKQFSQYRLILGMLLFHCLLPIPFMLIRLFGARDALESMQGRHVLFLAGPAFAILFVFGLTTLFKFQISNFKFSLTLALLLVGSLSKLILMQSTYEPLLPVTTIKPDLTEFQPLNITLDGGATLLGYNITEQAEALKVTFIWQGGAVFAKQDYMTELQLIDKQNVVRAQWLGYQTQARYPTRAWEAGDYIRDETWLPLPNKEIYQIKARLGEQWVDLGQTSQVCQTCEVSQPMTWQNGHKVTRPFHERETIQITLSPSSTDLYQLLDPLGQPHPSTAHGTDWATFIVEPDWPVGDYQLIETNTANLIDTPIEIAPNNRTFLPPVSGGNEGGLITPTVQFPVQANFAGQVKLLGYDILSRKTQAGEGVSLTLYWQGLQYMGEDFVIFARLLDNQQVVWGQRDRLPLENYSTLLWSPREIIKDSFAIPIDPAALPGVYRLHIGLYHTVNEQAESLYLLDSATQQPTDTTFVALAPIKIGGSPAGVTLIKPQPQPNIKQSFGDQIQLLGYDWLKPPPQSGSWTIRFYWQAMTELTTDYTLFMHVRDQNGQIVAQHDQPPTQGQYPTSLWDTTEIIQDELNLTVDKLPPGPYEIVIGLYDPMSQMRLPVTNSSDNTFTLQSFEVKP